MKPPSPIALALAATALTGCAQGNLRTPSSYAALAPTPVRNPWYDPYAPYGSSNAIWRPARLRPAANHREADRASLASLAPRLRGRGMGDRGWRRIDPEAAWHILIPSAANRHKGRSRGIALGTPPDLRVRTCLRLCWAHREKGAACETPPLRFQPPLSSNRSARPEAVRRRQEFQDRDLPTLSDLIVLKRKTQRE